MLRYKSANNISRKNGKIFAIFSKSHYIMKLSKEGRLAQLVRAFALHAKCRRFESVIAHQSSSRQASCAANGLTSKPAWRGEVRSTKTARGRLPRRNLQSR